jgi:hypothetical protein
MSNDIEKDFPNIFEAQWMSPTGHIASNLQSSDPGGPLPQAIGSAILELLENPHIAMKSIRTVKGRIFEMSRNAPGQDTITTREIKCPQPENN